MRGMLTIAAATFAVAAAAGPAVAAMDAKARLVDGVEKAIADEQRVLKELKKGFHASSFVKGSGDKARQSAADVEDDLRAASGEVVLDLLAIRDYLKATTTLSAPLRDQAKSGTATLRKQLNSVKQLDTAALKVPLRRDVDAYAEDTSSEHRRDKVKADLNEIRHNLTKAMPIKQQALQTANGLPPIPPPTKGNGSISLNPKYGPDCGCKEQYDGAMTLNQQESDRSPGFGIVLPPGYAVTTAGGVPGHGCHPGGASFTCEWEGPYTDPANNAYQYNITFVFGTNPPLSPVDMGNVMACYGENAPIWQSPAPSGCFFLSGS